VSCTPQQRPMQRAVTPAHFIPVREDGPSEERISSLHNGQSERNNQTMEELVRAFVDADGQVNWVQLLSQ
jgi:hypothetical protein